MTDQRQWYAGIDWASQSHHVFFSDGDGRRIGERAFDHGGEGLAEMVAWLLAKSGAQEAAQILTAIEVPHGPVVETLLERGFRVYAINPKQVDRFRDRFSPAGAKDDSRDAAVMASGLRTDPRCFRDLAATDPVIIELREWSRISDDLGTERNRLTNRLREQLWRYLPAFLELVDDDLGAEWLLELWEAAPTPAKAARLHAATVAKLLKRHRIRRFDAAQVLAVLRKPPIQVAAGTTEAARAHIVTLIARIRLPNRQLKQAHHQLDALTARLVPAEESEPGQHKQNDVEILASLPGVGRIVLATLLTEACDALQRRDYAALRSLTGVAPVTKRSGKSCIIVRRYACHGRLANAIYHWARVATQRDPRSRAKYTTLRSRGHSHARALRSVADRLVNVACAMLKTGTVFDPSITGQTA
ncbi:IS110 family transposase [Mesorhizobium sp. L-8-3]|uniref:IS110 family transposase n=1 Tax=Mesorhizobium sp. L-8-3 TaxID=2744522 RepID=UPI00192616A1|nr:IS110 family transposase [Mesorhizobium sp. L-8-3]BCH21513.1 IS110 family transposase [Mesorhizobium sp. L-8-3]